MTLVPTREIVDAALATATGVGAFNVIHLETAQALAAGAELAGRGVILQISQNCVRYHGALEPIALGAMAIARAVSVPVAMHLDHADDEALIDEAIALGFGSVMVPVAMHLDHADDKALIDEAIALGFGSVMFDAARLGYDDNVAATTRVATRAHGAGVFVEAELGEISGKLGAHETGVRTDPGEARAFVEATGVDALAVAVGSSHAMTERSATLDLELIERLRESVTVPLVLHGSSGVPDDQLRAAIRAGVTKINVSTHFNGQFTRAIREYLAEYPLAVDSRSYLARGREAVAVEAARLLDLFATP
jgi:fructose-bisphosphate aldolase class II